MNCRSGIILRDMHHYGESEDDAMTRRREVMAVVAGALAALTVVGAYVAMFLISSP